MTTKDKRIKQAFVDICLLQRGQAGLIGESKPSLSYNYGALACWPAPKTICQLEDIVDVMPRKRPNNCRLFCNGLAILLLHNYRVTINDVTSLGLWDMAYLTNE